MLPVLEPSKDNSDKLEYSTPSEWDLVRQGTRYKNRFITHVDAGNSLRHQAQDVKVAYLCLAGVLKISLNTCLSLSSVSHNPSFLIFYESPAFCGEYKSFSRNAGTGTSPRDLQHPPQLNLR